MAKSEAETCRSNAVIVKEADCYQQIVFWCCYSEEQDFLIARGLRGEQAGYDAGYSFHGFQHLKMSSRLYRFYSELYMGHFLCACDRVQPLLILFIHVQSSSYQKSSFWLCSNR